MKDRMREFPHHIVYFEAFVKDGDRLRSAYGGIIDPSMLPCSQREYNALVKKTLEHYRRAERVIKIELRHFYAGSSSRNVTHNFTTFYELKSKTRGLRRDAA